MACDKGSAFASTERGLVAVKDFYVEPGLPRFLTKGDNFSFGIKGFNTTDLSGSMELELSSSPNLNLDQPLQGNPSSGPVQPGRPGHGPGP